MTEKYTKEGLSPRTLAAVELVVRLLGVEPLDIRQTSSPDAWFVELPGDRGVVVKTPGWLNRPGSPRVEAWIYSECERRNIRAPKVLAVSEDPECLILERLQGHSLTTHPASMTASDRASWARAGEDLRKLHEVPMPGFGPLVPGPDKPSGEAATWCPYADYARAEGIPWLVDAGHLTAAAADSLARRFDEAASALSQVTEGRLLHGDVESGHIFVADDQFQGMIDFGQAQAGDPRWDLARVPLWDGDEALDALLAGYGSDAVTREDRDLLLPLYLFSLVVHHAVGHGRPDHIQNLLDRSRYHDLL
ncbi:phosphotransferase family protein [Actinopolymorpha rutila]|uniref:Aminoglycoside phosphotransferase domain-containing protein n=1 Tax=Actinopolymorpha rutila TaxID=446787 RepID=A0A852ZLY0_9ACTN|nr:aminoglycoside phosphotransferase family protein [Actinopolymorpha rutila]NYH92878.1 hypothetical protein [Actinopolymorpha rutila]